MCAVQLFIPTCDDVSQVSGNWINKRFGYIEEPLFGNGL